MEILEFLGRRNGFTSPTFYASQKNFLSRFSAYGEPPWIFERILDRVRKGLIKKEIEEKVYKAGIITLSDKSYAGMQADTSGALLKEMLVDHVQIIKQIILPDDQTLLQATLIDWCATCDLVLTTGGTGLSARDFTPEATLQVADRLIPGISEGLRLLSLSKTPFSMLSRGVAVQRGQTLIINLPGSPNSVKDYIIFLLPILPHALELVVSGQAKHNQETNEG